MDKILIENYEVVCCHGVNPEEKEIPQRFLVSCVIESDITRAAKSDEVDQTVSYSAVCKLIKAFLCENCFNLLETIAVRLSKKILTTFPIAKGVTVTVKKPDAPMKGNFDWVGVETTLKWHTAYLSIGSNLGDRKGYLDFAIKSLADDDNIKDVRESSRIETKPYGDVATQTFLNSAVEIKTLYSPFDLLDRLHEIEKNGDRVRFEHWGNRTLDMDIIFYDDLYVEADDLVIPHADMRNRLFVLEPLNELCPNKIHPVCGKRVYELLEKVKRGS